MIDSLSLTASSAQETANIAQSLTRSLYHAGTFILLQGELGAGKTVFTQGIARGLGLQDTVTSPTYAVEERYGDTLLHIDLFRLEREEEARSIVHAAEEFPGLRVIEWPERAGSNVWHGMPRIEISLSEIDGGRSILFSFHDLPLPGGARIGQWREECMLPSHIVAHNDAVARVTETLCADLVRRGIVVRREAARQAALLHDLLRFTEFKDDTDASPPQVQTWEALRKKYGTAHEEAAARFLTDRGYPELGSIVRTHGQSMHADPHAFTVEQFVVGYADKRVLHDRTVTLEERFRDFGERYGGGKTSPEQRLWQREMIEIEAMLFPNGITI